METMTSGSAYRHLWRYALPLILGNWLQLAYNAADSVIAGRFLGAQALAAEGAAAPANANGCAAALGPALLWNWGMASPSAG